MFYFFFFETFLFTQHLLSFLYVLLSAVSECDVRSNNNSSSQRNRKSWQKFIVCLFSLVGYETAPPPCTTRSRKVCWRSCLVPTATWTSWRRVARSSSCSRIRWISRPRRANRSKRSWANWGKTTGEENSVGVLLKFVNIEYRRCRNSETDK